MILLADRVSGSGEGQIFLGGMDVSVQRNYFGSQVSSSVTAVCLSPALLEDLKQNESAEVIDAEGLPCGVFIRAPAIVSLGSSATGLAWVALPASGTTGSVETMPICVAASQGSLLATAFHPELTSQRSFHRLFMRMVAAAVATAAEVLSASTTIAIREVTEAGGGSHRQRVFPCAGAPSAIPADISLPSVVLSASRSVPYSEPGTLTPGTTAASSYRLQS